jgi:hypothetical protein
MPTSSGNGIFRRQSATPAPASPQTAHHALSPSATATTGDSAEPRRRHGSAPLITALGLLRRESASAAASTSTSPANATPSQRSFTLDLASVPPRKLSEPSVVHKPSPLSPKRKPVPKGPAIETKSPLQQDDDLSGKLGKLDLASGGSTMVFSEQDMGELMVDCWQMYVL